jgi:acyl carrier protein
MTHEAILNKLQVAFDDTFIDKVEVTDSLSAADVPEWSSLQNISLVLTIESMFGVRFRVGEVEGAKNIGELAGVIQRHLAAKPQ